MSRKSQLRESGCGRLIEISLNLIAMNKSVSSFLEYCEHLKIG